MKNQACSWRMVSGARRTRPARIVLSIALGLALGGAAMAAGPSVALAVECGYPACHGGAPVPGTETSATPTLPPAPVPVTLSLPTVSRRPRARRTITFTGKLSAAHYAASSVRLELSRRIRGRFVAYRTVTVAVAAGADAYSFGMKLPSRGAWRVRATHADDAHSASASSHRTFLVR